LAASTPNYIICKNVEIFKKKKKKKNLKKFKIFKKKKKEKSLE